MRKSGWMRRSGNSGIGCSSAATRLATRASWNGWDLNRKRLIKYGSNSDNPHAAGGALGASAPLTMNRYSISKIARACGLSRSTLLSFLTSEHLGFDCRNETSAIDRSSYRKR